ncbi:hypothetical protein LIA77_11122 [Sarocladium implicatum]|nr:hypothetical protein LIA77_11122 [Sarocladium implicatum]
MPEVIKKEISDDIAQLHQASQLPPITLDNIGNEGELLRDILKEHLEVSKLRTPKEAARQRFCCFLSTVFLHGTWDTSKPPIDPCATPPPPFPSYRCQVSVLKFTLPSEGYERLYLSRIFSAELPDRLATRIPARQAGQPVFLRALVKIEGPITWLYTDFEDNPVPYDATVFYEEFRDLSAQRKVAADNFDRAEQARAANANGLLAIEMAQHRLVRWAKIPNRAEWRVEEADKGYIFLRPLSAWDAMQRDHESDDRALASRFGAGSERKPSVTIKKEEEK